MTRCRTRITYKVVPSAPYAPDRVADPTIRFVDRTFVLWARAGLAVPFGLGVAIGESVRAGLTGLLSGGAVRLFVLHHVTFSINSICHVFSPAVPHVGRVAQRVLARAAVLRRVLAQQPPRLPDLGVHGLGGWQLDPSALVIRGLEACRLAWDVVRVSPERQRKAALPGRRVGHNVRMGGDPGPRQAGRFPRLGGSSSSGRSAVITRLTPLPIVDVRGAAFYTAWTLIGLALVARAPQRWLHLRRLRRSRDA